MPEFSSGSVVISSGVTSTGIVVVQTARLEILDGGMTIEAGAAGGGAIVVSGGGLLDTCMVSSGGTATVLNEGYASNVTVEDVGVYLVSSGGYATKSEVRSGGVMRIYADTRAANAVVKDGGMLEVGSDGYSRAPVLSQGGLIRVVGGILDSARIAGKLEIVSGGMVNSSTVLDGGEFRILGDDSFAIGIGISSGGTAHVSSGCGFFLVSMFEGASAVVSEGGRCTTVNLDGGSLTVLSGASLEGATVDPGGALQVYSGGVATGVRENGGWVEVANGADVTFAANTVSNLSLADASATVHFATTATNVMVGSGGRLDVFSGGKLTGEQTFEAGAAVSMCEGAILDFDISGLTPASGAAARINDLSIVQGTPVYTLTVSASQPDGVYSLAEGAAGFDGTITVRDTLGESFGTLTVGDSIKIGDADCILSLNGPVLTFVVQTGSPVPENLVGTKDRVSWNPSTGAIGYVVEYSMDDFGSVLSVETSATAVDILELPAGTYQWRVKADGGEEWAVGEEIVSDNDSAVPTVVRSNGDGSGDLFFASASGTWENNYFAQHVGSVKDWTGTNTFVSAGGKGRIQNLFFGSADPNVLCLTDGENGDAIFVDDAYTELPDEIETNMARLYRIREIRAGAGDDIVDMTSQQFEYTGDGLTIRGGDGSDTIWANKGDNWLFGDDGNDRIVGASGNDVIAGGIGNDRMHGGGGNDVFTFCDNWGVDNVEQLATGSVTLWFAESESQITASEIDGSSVFTNAAGTGSVTVKGFALADIAVKYGDDGSDDYATLASAGAFFDSTTERIFEEYGKGMLARL